MIVASGFVEVDDQTNVQNIVNALKAKEIEVNEILSTRIVFLIERETIGNVKTELESLRDIEGVRNVHLAYYSLEGSDKGPDFESGEKGNA